MGGKKKTEIQPRVKDNLKPSSSDKAAQFLVQQTGGLGLPNEIFKISSSAFQSPKLVNNPFDSGSLSTVLGFIPIPQSSNVGDVESGLLRLLKRLDKRHSVTKQKALVELTELLKVPPGSETDYVKDCEIVSVLPYWPQIFCRLTQDGDRQVREHAQTAMAALASRACRNLAPFIKQILPVWAFATVDSHEPAAAAARRGLADTFPGPKRSEANRIYSRQILDMVEVKLDEALKVSATDTTANSGAEPKKKQKTAVVKRNDGEQQQGPADTGTGLTTHSKDSSLLHLSATLRFLSALLEDFAGLPPDHNQLSRLKGWLAPDQLWTRIARQLLYHLRGDHTRCRRLTCTMSSVHSALYQISACLCKSPYWSNWLSTEGELTARYLCRSTVTRLDTCLTAPGGAQTVDRLFIPPPLIYGSSTCYAKCWEAALLCLGNLPADLVWSEVDWTEEMTPQLLNLMLYSDPVYARQIFLNLVSLLNSAPINFNDLSLAEEAMIEQIFVQSALKGIERFLLPSSLSGDRGQDKESSGPPTSTDPGACVHVVTGVLKCSLHLIGRILQGSRGQDSGKWVLLDLLVDKVIFRLLLDALDAPPQEEGDSYTPLICNQPAIFRQAYLKVVFSEFAQLLCHLNVCEYQPKPREVYQNLSRRLINLLVSTETHATTTTPHTDEIAYRLGQIDPLRFITFIDHLTSKTIARPVATARDSTPPGWIVDLLSEIAVLVSPKACEKISAIQYLVYLSLYANLPIDLQTPIIGFSSVIFDLLLPQLPSEVHSVCWLDTVVAGVATIWTLSSDLPGSVVATPSADVLSHFLTDLLPPLIRYSATTTISKTVNSPSWCHHFAHLLEQWIQAWTEATFTSSRICDAMTQTVSAVFSLGQTGFETTTACLLQTTVLHQLDACLQTYLSTDEYGLLVPVPDLPFAHVMTAHVISDLVSNVDRVSWSLRWSPEDVDCLHRKYVTLLKLVFVLCQTAVDGIVLTSPSQKVSSAEVLASTQQCLLQFIRKQLILASADDRTDLNPFLVTVNDLLFTQVTRTACVTRELVSFTRLLYSEFSTNSTEKVAELWLSKLTSTVRDVVEHLATEVYADSRLDVLPLGHLFELPTMQFLRPLGALARLHQFGVFFELHRHLVKVSRLWNQYLQCLGLLRVWTSSLSEPWSLEMEFGLPALLISPSCWPEPSPSQSGANLVGSVDSGKSLESELGRLWCANVSHLPLPSLMAVMETTCVLQTLPPLKTGLHGQEIITTSLNSLWRNRLRSIHPNDWPQPLQLATSCAHSPSGVTWFDTYILNATDRLSESEMDARFRRFCELYLPLGVVRRCLPRGKLLALVRSVSHGETSTAFDAEVGARILQMISNLVSVRTAAPVFVTTFVKTVTTDYRDWLTELTDDLDAEGLASLTTSSPVYRALVSVMNYCEVMLLLWQPWQWIVNASDRLQLSNRLGLIQLSLRLRHLRPCLDAGQWDFVMCSLLGWQTIAVGYLLSLPELSTSQVVTPGVLFTNRTFRVAAAMGALFIGRQNKLPNLSEFLATSKPRKSSSGVTANEDEWGDDFDQEVDDDGAYAGKELYPYPDSSDDEEANDGVGGEMAPLDDKALMEALDRVESAADAEESETTDDVSSFGVDEIDEKTVGDDLDGSGGLVASSVQAPRRGRVPKSIISDWNNFFCNHLYSSLLSAVFHTCLVLHEDGSAPKSSASSLDTSPHIQSLCAAFATCPAAELVSVLTEQPNLVLEYLVDLPGVNSPTTGQLLPSVCCSINDLTSGFRAALDLASRLIATCRHQPGQLLGHILLTRLISASAQRSGSTAAVNVSNYLIHRLPKLWLQALHGKLPPSLETGLLSDVVSQAWGSGQQASTYLASGNQLDADAHHSLLSFLLAWDCLLSLLTCAGPQARARLQRALLGPAGALFDRLLLSLGLLLPQSSSLERCATTSCRLEPDERLLLPVSVSHTTLKASTTFSGSSNGQQRSRRPMRLTTPLASGDDSQWREAFGPDDRLVFLPSHRLASDISHMATRLLRRFLSEAPALFRSWHRRLASGCGTLSEEEEVGVDHQLKQSCPQAVDTRWRCSSPLANQRTGRLRQLANGIEKLISRHFSPIIAQDEVLLVQHRAYLRYLARSDSQKKASRSIFSLFGKPSEVGEVTVRSRPSSREVIAVYQATEEHSFEMVIQLPANYPLSPTTVTYDRNVVVNKQDWHIWTVQLSVFINNQNGSIIDGIDLWQRNVQKLFQGVEECAICYSIMHHNNFSLPKMRCHTCRKLFHYACMHRWFTTSKNPACPLCRNLFYDITGSPRG